MSRTAVYKGIYFATLAGAGVLVLVALSCFHFSSIALVAVLLALLVPGRILGFFWGDLLRGLRLLNAREYAQSKTFSERFLAEVRRRPWIKHLVWLGSSSYSRDPEVLALNNMGAAEVALGELDLARKHLGEAVALDSLCPLPFYNLGVLANATDDSIEAERCFAQAAKLGFARGLSDKIVMASQTRFANIGGR
jgi:tetratricopeptide (TPR) repeat protein